MKKILENIIINNLKLSFYHEKNINKIVKNTNKNILDVYEKYYYWNSYKNKLEKYIKRKNVKYKMFFIHYYMWNFYDFYEYLRTRKVLNNKEKAAFEIWMIAYNYFEDDLHWSAFLESILAETVYNILHLIENGDIEKFDSLTLWTSWDDIKDKWNEVLIKYNLK